MGRVPSCLVAAREFILTPDFSPYSNTTQGCAEEAGGGSTTLSAACASAATSTMEEGGPHGGGPGIREGGEDSLHR